MTSHAGVVLNEGFETVTATGVPTGWLLSPASTLNVTWNKALGASGEFAAQAGTATSYLFNSYNSTPTGTGMIDDFVITPSLTITNGTILSFWVKADPIGEAAFPDRLRVLYNTTGATTLASFTNLVRDINPTYSATGFPTDWTQYSYTVVGLTGTTTARFAFEYLLTNTNTQGNFIGLDSVTVTVPEPDSLALIALGMIGVGLGLRGRRKTARRDVTGLQAQRA